MVSIPESSVIDSEELQEKRKNFLKRKRFLTVASLI
jgi:hypothetical protein